MSDPIQRPDPSTETTDAGDDQIQPFVISLPDDPASGNDWYLWAAVLALIALVAFWPAINGTWLWDDDQYVTHNRTLLDADGLKQIWEIPPGTIQYYPLTFTALWIEHQVWGNSPLGYRVVNLLLHAGSAIVLWRILRRLKIPAAWAAAAIWAVHPLQAESVCWISECKNVLSAILALASVLFYLEFAGLYDPAINKRTWNLSADWQTYAISAAFFVLAALAKTAVVLLPVVVLLILWWKGRLNPARAIGIIPLLIVGAALGLETSHLETNPNGAIGAFGPEWNITFLQRLLISGRDFWFYIAKLIAPVHQSFIYPRVLPSPASPAPWAMLLAAIALLIVLWAMSKPLGKGPLVAFLAYLLLLFPALGFFNVYPFRYSFVADHFQYLAGIPLIVLAVSALARLFAPLWKTTAIAPEPAPYKTSPVIAVLVTILLIVLSATAWVRADVFSDPAKLWADVLLPDKNPDSWLAGFNLARVRQSDAAATFDDAAHMLQEGDADASKQTALDALTTLDQSDALLQRVLDNPATPDNVRYRAYDQLAENDVTRLRSPDSDSTKILPKALDEMQQAMSFPQSKVDPLPYYTLGVVQLNLAQALEKKVKPTTRLTSIPAATQPLAPQERTYADLYEQARDNFQHAYQLASDAQNSPTIAPEATQVQPLAALQAGNIDWTLAAQAMEHGDRTTEQKYGRDAVTDYANAVRLNPTNEETRYRLALALENQGDLTGAKDQLLVILRDLDHYNAQAYNEIGRVILAQNPNNMADFQAAVESFKAALKLNPNYEGAQRNLDMAMRMLATSRPTTREAATREATTPEAAATQPVKPQ